MGAVVAANPSKPGDALYSIDRGAETVQLAFALTDGSKKNVHATLATERLSELQALYAEDELDTDGIANARQNYEEHHAELADLIDDDGVLDEEEETEEIFQQLEQQKEADEQRSQEAEQEVELEDEPELR